MDEPNSLTYKGLRGVGSGSEVMAYANVGTKLNSDRTFANPRPISSRPEDLTSSIAGFKKHFAEATPLEMERFFRFYCDHNEAYPGVTFARQILSFPAANSHNVDLDRADRAGLDRNAPLLNDARLSSHLYSRRLFTGAGP